MPTLSPVESLELRDAVRDAYSAAAAEPTRKHAFPVGRAFALSLGYPVDLLSALPAESVEAFAGVSNVSLFAEIPAGSTVLDLGCGAGLDSLVAARRAGPGGAVIGVDFSEPMLARARTAAGALDLPIHFCHADAERLPLENGTVDVALVNGIFNLNPARAEIFRELGRVLKRGGAAYVGELVLQEPLPPAEGLDRARWFA